METETNNMTPLLDILVSQKGPMLTRKVYTKSTHNGCYFHYQLIIHHI